MRSQASRRATLALGSLFLFCLFLALGYGALPHQAERDSDRHENLKRASEDLSWLDTIVHGPAHQNPAKAPHAATLEDIEFDTLLESSSNLTSRQEHSLERRADGPLYCTDGPCIDGSCCGAKNICGYGPDFCGTGCQSQCNATAMCGEYSEDANMPCGMKLCCSATGWCGTTEVYCHNADPLHGTLPCQAGYGSCAITGSPSCPQGSGSSKGRTIGYYQSWNARTRACNKVLPKQLDTKGYTHLFFSFAFIDPNTYTIATAHPDDIPLMKEFTDLSKGSSLKTWIAIGGFDMSNPEAATHKTWSQMVATKANRAAFIASVKTYMDTHGFTGVDLDWEYPGAPERGGNKLADTRNLSLLVKEMRAAYGSAYGISLTLAPDYWYLRWFDAKAMEPYVDFFGFMAYDLHGSWDADVKALGKKVRGQADIQEISKNTVPLWFDGLNPAKLNFGLAMYGRGYTLADPSCSDLLCPFAGPSKPAPCTNFEGVMSLIEIEQLIKRRGIKPKYLPDSMMKQITWDDQWIGYDDEETFAAKRAFADGLCFGGTMIWSIDFQVPGSGGPDDDPEIVLLAPAVYSGTPAQCTGPCQFVLPPRALPSKTTISVAPYTTSLLVAPDYTTTLTVKIPPIVTNSLDYYNVNITSGQTGGFVFTPTVSINIPPVVTTITLPGNLVQTRTLVVPPWPAIIGTWPSDKPSTQPDTLPPFEPTSVAPVPPPTFEPTSKPPFTMPEPGDDKTTGTWPSTISLKPVQTEVPEGGEDDDGDGPTSKSTCKLWFFWICIKWPEFNIEIAGWEWNLPVGIWGPGPPPIGFLKLPPGFTIKGTLPPWPKITVLPGGAIQPPPKPNNCKPAEASLCYTVSSFATTVSRGTTKTTATQVKSTCATITGCNFQDVEATRSVDVCSLTRRAVEVTQPPEITGKPVKRAIVERAEPDWTRCGSNGKVGIIWPKEPSNSAAQQRIQAILKRRDDALKNAKKTYGYKEFRSQKLGFTAFYILQNMDTVAKNWFNSREADDVLVAYYPPEYDGKRKRSINQSLNGTDATTLDKREMEHVPTANWHLSQISMPEDYPFDEDFVYDDGTGHFPSKKEYSYIYDTSLGDGQRVYVLDEGWFGEQEASYSNANPREMTGFSDFGNGPYVPSQYDREHGYLAASYAVGSAVGLATKAELVFVPIDGRDMWLCEKLVEALLLVADDFTRGLSTVVSISLGYNTEYAEDDKIWVIVCQLLRGMEDQGIMFVVAGPNPGDTFDAYPTKCVDKMNALLIVGATEFDGSARRLPPHDADDMSINVWAPGGKLPVPNPAVLTNPEYSGGASGTSFATPLVAGLVAYYRMFSRTRAFPAPSFMKQTVLRYSRNLERKSPAAGNVPAIIWNVARHPDFELVGENCRSPQGRDLDARQAGDGACPMPGPRGPPVTYKPGPPAPLCTANCGRVCSGFYCNPNPTGTPPDFAPPWQTSAPTNTAGNGGGFDLTNLPTLPPQTTAPPEGHVCASSTTATRCNGGPQGGVCITQTSCASWTSSIFHLTGLPTLGPVPSPSGGTCIKSTTWTITGGPHGEATATTSGCALWEVPGPTTAPAPPPPPPPKPRCMAAHVFMSNCAFQPDSVNVQIWENGVEVCRTGDGKHWASDQTVFNLECDNGAKAVVKDNARYFEYTAKDGWKPEIFSVKYNYESTVCYQLDMKTIKGSDMESTWGGGNCGQCKAPAMCGLYTCSKNDVSCSF